jgi:hypothetical protein
VAYLGPLDRVVPKKKRVGPKKAATHSHSLHAGWLAGCPPSNTRGTILLGHVSTITVYGLSSYTCGEMGIRTYGHLSFVHVLRKKFHKENERKRNLL